MLPAITSITNNIYFQFIYGTLGIYIFAAIGSVLHEKVYSPPHLASNKNTKAQH